MAQSVVRGYGTDSHGTCKPPLVTVVSIALVDVNTLAMRKYVCVDCVYAGESWHTISRSNVIRAVMSAGQV